MDTERFNTHAFARKLASEMGQDWEAEIPSDDAYREVAYVRQVEDHSCQIYISGPSRYGPKGRIYLSGRCEYFEGGGNGLAYHESVASITVAWTKTPGQVAKDIHRRLLPTYLDQHARNQAYLAQQRAWKAQETDTKAAIEAMFQAYKRTHPYVSGAVYLTIGSDGATQAQLTLSRLPLDLAQQILNLLP